MLAREFLLANARLFCDICFKKEPVCRIRFCCGLVSMCSCC